MLRLAFLSLTVAAAAEEETSVDQIPIDVPEDVPDEQAASVVEIMSGVRDLRNHVTTWFEDTGKRLTEKNETDAATALTNFANDWFSYIGWSKGITGLAKDFMMQYYGRQEFHDKNGPIINRINALRAILTADNKAHFEEAVKGFIKEGSSLFAEEGSINNMFSELREIEKNPEVFKQMLEGEAEWKQIGEGLSFLTQNKYGYRDPRMPASMPLNPHVESVEIDPDSIRVSSDDDDLFPDVEIDPKTGLDITTDEDYDEYGNRVKIDRNGQKWIFKNDRSGQKRDAATDGTTEDGTPKTEDDVEL